MKLLFVFIFNIILLAFLLISPARGQDLPVERVDTLRENSVPRTSSEVLADTTENADSPLIRRLELSLDYLKLVSFALPAETKMEVGAAIITKPNLGISIEIGYGAKMPEDHFKNAEYKVEGMYGRVGLNYHLAINPKANFYFGAKYAMSNYEDEGTYTIESSLWDSYQDNFGRTGLSARWVEIIAGSESQFKGNFCLGFIFRFRAMISQDNFSPLEVYAVPGYGRTMDKTIPAVNLYIKYMIGFK